MIRTSNKPAAALAKGPALPHAPSSPIETPPRDLLDQALQDVANRVAPVWPLSDFVAVNPFLGWADQDWLQARRSLRNVAAVDTLMPLSYYRSKLRQGELGTEDLEAAIDELLRDGIPGAETLDAAAIKEELLSVAPAESEAEPSASAFQSPAMEPLTAVVDRYAQSDWSQFVVDEISKVCGAHYDEGHAVWGSPWQKYTLYQAWRSAAAHDRRAEVAGLSGFRRFIAQLPLTPQATIACLLDRLGVPQRHWQRFLLCQAFTVMGWASRCKYEAVQAKRCGEESDDLLAVIAIRLAYDAAVSECHGITVDWSTIPGDEYGDHQDVLLRNCLLRASEVSYRRSLLSHLADAGDQSHDDGATAPKLARFVFCIDVRSERIRRALESCSDQIETSGFAGFFGIPMQYLRWGACRAASHVPAPLAPRFLVEEGLAQTHDGGGKQQVLRRRQFVRKMRRAWKAFQSSAVGSFGFVETAGWWAAAKMATRTFALGGNPRDGRFDGLPAADSNLLGPQLANLAERGVSTAELVELARSVLKNLGLTAEFPRFVVLCGHASETTNNPLQASLDCGACCGHSGEASARFAAALLNMPAVRSGLAADGIIVPGDTRFVAAVHNTISDRITFLDVGDLPASHWHDLQTLSSHTQFAAAKTRSERMPALAARDDADLLRRAHDWSEVRPEWGLAGNAALVVGPRTLTRGASLDGRAFLHDYDYRHDDDGSVLELIMTAPMVVTHWINMQYYASVVDNRQWGSGSKPIHNVVGRFGLLAGGGGDLLTGLPLQSLHDGEAWRHEPLRLQAVVAAPRERIAGIVARHELLRNLISNGWLYLVAEEDGRFHRLTRRLAWLPLHVEHDLSGEKQADSSSAEYVDVLPE